MTAPSINLSANELSALLKQCFEVSCYKPHDHEDLAAAVVWLEMHGLPGIAGYLEAAPSIKQRQSKLRINPMTGRLNINCGGASQFAVACNIVDSAIALASDHGRADSRIINTVHQLALVPGLARCAARQLHAVVVWAGEPTGTVHIAAINAGQLAPSYRIVSDNTDFSLAPTEGVMFCGQSSDERNLHIINTIKNIAGAGTEIMHKTPEEFRRTFERSLDEGVAVDQASYDALTSIAANVLVAASEQSRRGAGE